MSTSFDHLVVAAYRGRSSAELAQAPPEALKGVSAADAARLGEAFGISTVAEMASNASFAAAVTIAAAAGDGPGFDPGPPLAWGRRFASAPLETYQHRPELFRLAFGPVYYRGRLDGTARLLVVGQDPSVNEILAHRIFVGQSGQRLQGLLAKLGLSRSYVMLNTFLYSIFNQFGGENAALSHQDPILGYRNSLFDAVAADGALRAILTVGSAARDAVDRWPGSAGLARAQVLHPAFPDVAQLLANWNAALADLRARLDPDDETTPGAPYGTAFAPGDVVPIPRRDLPFGLPDWHGTGDHGRRSGDTIIEWHSHPV